MDAADARPIFVLDEALLRWRGQEVVVTPQQAIILGRLYKAAGHFVPIERLSVAVWPAQQPECFVRQIYKQIGRLRRKFRAAGLPIKIEGRWGYGYRLTGEIEVM